MLEKADIPDLAGLRQLTPEERKQRSSAMTCLGRTKDQARGLLIKAAQSKSAKEFVCH